MSTKVKLLCAMHPKYKGSLEPKTDCIICWKIYATNLRLQLEKAKND